MAAITGAAIAAAAAVGSAAMSAKGAKDAARTQQRGYDAATREQARQFDASMEMTRPRREVEGNALNLLAQMTGVRGSNPRGVSGPIDPNTGQPIGVQMGENGAPDYSAFFNSPDYQFALDQGLQATERSAAAGGKLRSGNTLAALTRYGQGMATQNINNYLARLGSLAGMGADQNAANMATNFGNTTANNLIGGANARASGVAGQTNAWSNGLNQLGQLGGYAMQTWGSAPKTSPLIKGANTTYQTPPYVQPGSGYGGNMRRVA